MAKERGKLKALIADIGFVAMLLVLGALQYGWVIWPQLGWWWGAVQVAVLTGIIVGAAFARLYRKLRSWDDAT